MSKAATTSTYRVVIESIGDAGLGVISALRPATQLTERELARALYQAPAELFDGLEKGKAESVSEMLAETGLRLRVAPSDEAFEPGEGRYEVALAVRDWSRAAAIVQQVMTLLGVDGTKARAMLCTSPTLLMGQVSAATVAEVERRFSPLGVEVDVSEPAKASFDAFVGRCQPSERGLLERMVREAGLELEAGSDRGQPLLCAGMTREQGDELWQRGQRHNLPLKIVNRDFQRYDLQLDAAEQSPDLLAHLGSSTGMPESVARKVLARLPVVLHQNISHARLGEEARILLELGAQVTAHLLSFQSLGLRLDEVGDGKLTESLLQVIGGLSAEDASRVVGQAGPRSAVIEGLSMTNPQAHWLLAELAGVGSRATLHAEA